MCEKKAPSKTKEKGSEAQCGFQQRVGGDIILARSCHRRTQCTQLATHMRRYVDVVDVSIVEVDGVESLA
jgi:hypothetical protein